MLEYKVGDKTYSAWKKVFSIQEKVYQELVAEFLLTFQFNKEIRDYKKKSITFTVQNKPYQISLSTFAFHLELYTRVEVGSKIFSEGLIDERGADSPESIWDTYGTGPYKSNVKATSFRRPSMQIVHKLITTLLYAKKEASGSVVAGDLYLLKAMVDKKNIQVAYLLARRLMYEKKSNSKSHIFLGAVITRLVKKMGLLNDEYISSMTTKENWSPQPIDYKFLRLMRIIDIGKDDRIFWKQRKGRTDGPTGEIPGIIAPPYKRRREGRNNQEEEEEVERESRDTAPEVESRTRHSPVRFTDGDPITSRVMTGVVRGITEIYNFMRQVSCRQGMTPPSECPFIYTPRSEPGLHTNPPTSNTAGTSSRPVTTHIPTYSTPQTTTRGDLDGSFFNIPQFGTQGTDYEHAFENENLSLSALLGMPITMSMTTSPLTRTTEQLAMDMYQGLNSLPGDVGNQTNSSGIHSDAHFSGNGDRAPNTTVPGNIRNNYRDRRR